MGESIKQKIQHGFLTFGLTGTLLVCAVALRNQVAEGALFGFGGLFLAKYIVVGLVQWDKWFHPERLQADKTGPFQRYLYPFLGIFNKL